MTLLRWWPRVWNRILFQVYLHLLTKLFLWYHKPYYLQTLMSGILLMTFLKNVRMKYYDSILILVRQLRIIKHRNFSQWKTTDCRKTGFEKFSSIRHIQIYRNGSKSVRERERVSVIYLLIPARTDTRYFHDFIYEKEWVEIRFIKGRLKFGWSKNSAPFPSMLCIFKNPCYEKEKL